MNWQDFTNWLAEPFNPQQNAGGWFLAVGLLLVFLYAWHMIMRDIAEVARVA